MMESNTYLNSKSWRYFKILLLVYVFYSLNCWVFFSANAKVMRFAYPFLAIPFFLKKGFWDTSQRRVGIAFLLAVLYVYCSGPGNLNLYISNIFYFIFFCRITKSNNITNLKFIIFIKLNIN